MKKINIIITITTIIVLASVAPVSAGASSVLRRVLSGDFNGDGCVGNCSYGAPSYDPSPRLLPPTGNAAKWAKSPRAKAYYGAKDRIYRKAYRDWERRERQIGKAQGELEALQNIQYNQTHFFTRH